MKVMDVDDLNEMKIKPSIIVPGTFTSHSGIVLPFKIDCDNLSDEDIERIAWVIASKYSFWWVEGIPKGGLRLAQALEKYKQYGKNHALLIVDDVTTTGTSFENKKSDLREKFGAGTILGVTIFSRGSLPHWVTPLFTVNPFFS